MKTIDDVFPILDEIRLKVYRYDLEMSFLKGAFAKMKGGIDLRRKIIDDDRY